jgi:predicted methyltransferase
MSTQLDAAAIARLSLHDASHFEIQCSQTAHRLKLIEKWKIRPGSRLLELGCGQGDCTTALASAVGDQGTVVALDPASLDYGPFVQAPPLRHQAYMSQVHHIHSGKHRLTSRKARWADVSHGCNKHHQITSCH